jgi:hypothetical protein
MGRPAANPRSYVTRHIRFRKVVDVGIRRAAADERRGFNDLVQLVLEDWLRARAGARAAELGLGVAAAPRPRKGRQPAKPARKPQLRLEVDRMHERAPRKHGASV